MKVVFVTSDCESLGIEYLSAALKQGGHDCSLAFDPKLFDTELVSIPSLKTLCAYKKLLLRKITAIDPGLICFSVCSDNFAWALDLATAIKGVIAAPVIFGGIHPTIVPEEVIQYPSIDYVCVGEGEAAIVELVDALEGNRDVAGIANIWSKKDGTIYSNSPRRLVEDLDSLPLADKEIFAKEYPLFMGGYKIITSRGCPHLCTYCASHQLREIYQGHGKFIRRRSVANVIDELVAAKQKYNMKMVRFFDDVFTQDKAWLRGFSVRYKKEIALPYFCFISPDHCDDEVIALLENSGCATVFMGYGTFSEQTRREVLNRHYDNEKVAGLIRSFRRTNVYLIVDFILGLPEQTEDEVISMAKFFNCNRPDVLSGLFLRYYPKTHITRLAQDRGLLSDAQASMLSAAGFNERIIIEEKRYGSLKRIQTLIIFSKYLPRSVVEWLVRSGVYKAIFSLNLNNFSVIFDSVVPKFSRKRRIHTDTVSPFQYIHFYGHYIMTKFKFDISSAAASFKQAFRSRIDKIMLIYKLGLSRASLKKLFMTVRYLFRTKVLGRQCPGAVIIGLTYKCQCKCVHCSVCTYPLVPKEEMDAAQVKLLLNDIARCGIPKVNFFGGEPLILNTSIIELVRHGYHCGLSVSIDTNGIMLDEGMLKDLKSAGINNINVSIDSADKDTHDRLRGYAGVFEKAIEGLKLCVRENIPCVLSTYASKRNIHSGDLKRIIELGKQTGVTAVKILFPLMAGKWKDSQCDELLDPQEKQVVYDLLEPGFVYLESPLFSVKGRKKVCEALNRKMLYVSPYGDVQLCYAVPFSFGNIRKESFEAIVKRMWASKFFNSIDNNYDCVMNNPVFRAEFAKLEGKAETPPVDCAKI
ncbi:MAG: radical SAM protein [Candidatus Omnitrophica bacterium]|nr:radical SAM protein [Candidatus Omnitrophota bacterium]